MINPEIVHKLAGTRNESLSGGAQEIVLRSPGIGGSAIETEADLPRVTDFIVGDLNAQPWQARPRPQPTANRI